MSTITIRLNQEEEKAFNDYAKLQGIPLSTLLKNTLEEKLENEFDIQSIRTYEKDVEQNNIQTYSHNEIKELLGL